ncbi:TetR-like C-terminal domain-containing protein [Rhodococcus sp. G-MC3]|uniref:TetR/AcrR family transcriptional regulator n=1 Tax=Rhodococcus sp. G-MC3 TaxID=3046209 RepID=UPI0024BBAF4C|nr:TetR-like C-terminal domain-containing protein [Rhodococcus sp. G-MC3]MDJ0392440.1 TetR-like C-terminal domain-containing protein [Rhodococcus sp. G-MC3]
MNVVQAEPIRSRNARGEGNRLRDEIVAAATSLLQSVPAQAVTLRAVARAAGIAAPSIYRHFADLDAIFRAVVDLAFDELEVVLRAAPAGQRPVDRLRTVCAAYLSFAREHPQRYRVMFGVDWNASGTMAPSAEELDARAMIGQDALAVLIAAITECVEAGESSSVDPSADAIALWVGLHGLSTLRQTAPSFPWPSELEGALVTSLTRLTGAAAQ